VKEGLRQGLDVQGREERREIWRGKQEEVNLLTEEKVAEMLLVVPLTSLDKLELVARSARPRLHCKRRPL
jgi:hypothetical protein